MTAGYKRFTRNDAVLLSRRFLTKEREQLFIRKGKLLSEKWTKKIEMIDRPSFECFTSDMALTRSESFLGQLYFHDQNSPDIKALDLWSPSLLHKLSMAAFLCRAGLNTYPFNLSENPQPAYYVEEADSGFKIRTKTDCNTLVYLISRKKFPESYCLEFDFCPQTAFEETLQIDMCAESLADRLRFVLRNNREMQFGVWEDGLNLKYFDRENWKGFSRPCSLPLGSNSHIKCVVHRNIFAIFVDNNYVMGVRINGFSHHSAHFCLIFWNGVDGGQPISFEIKNPRVLY